MKIDFPGFLSLIFFSNFYFIQIIRHIFIKKKKHIFMSLIQKKFLFYEQKSRGEKEGVFSVSIPPCKISLAERVSSQQDLTPRERKKNAKVL